MAFVPSASPRLAAAAPLLQRQPQQQLLQQRYGGRVGSARHYSQPCGGLSNAAASTLGRKRRRPTTSSRSSGEAGSGRCQCTWCRRRRRGPRGPSLYVDHSQEEGGGTEDGRVPHLASGGGSAAAFNVGVVGGFEKGRQQRADSGEERGGRSGGGGGASLQHHGNYAEEKEGGAENQEAKQQDEGRPGASSNRANAHAPRRRQQWQEKDAATQCQMSKNIASLGRKGRWREVGSVLQRAKARGVQPNLVCYSAAITAVGQRCGRWREALGLLEELKQHSKQQQQRDEVDGRSGSGSEPSLRPDVVCYNAAIGSCARAGESEKAFELLWEMRREGLLPNVISYNSVLDGCGKAGDSALAERVIHEMKSYGVRADEKSYSAWISACGKDGAAYRRALAVMTEAQLEGGLRLDVVTYNCLITACAKSGEYDKALAMFRQMQAYGLRPNVYSYNALLKACDRAGNYRQVLLIFREMRKLGPNGSEEGGGGEGGGAVPTVVTYNTVLAACSKAREHKMAVFLVKDMISQGLAPTVITYGTLISVFANTGQCDEAQRVFDVMKERRIRPNVVCYSSLITAYGRVGQHEDALRVVRDMKRNGVLPNTVCYNALITACGNAGAYRQAMEVFTEMVGEGFQPDVVSYSALMAACGKAGAYDKALDMLRQLETLGGGGGSRGGVPVSDGGTALRSRAVRPTGAAATGQVSEGDAVGEEEGGVGGGQEQEADQQDAGWHVLPSEEEVEEEEEEEEDGVPSNEQWQQWRPLPSKKPTREWFYSAAIDALTCCGRLSAADALYAEAVSAGVFVHWVRPPSPSAGAAVGDTVVAAGGGVGDGTGLGYNSDISGRKKVKQRRGSAKGIGKRRRGRPRLQVMGLHGFSEGTLQAALRHVISVEGVTGEVHVVTTRGKGKGEGGKEEGSSGLAGESGEGIEYSGSVGGTAALTEAMAAGAVSPTAADGAMDGGWKSGSVQTYQTGDLRLQEDVCEAVLGYVSGPLALPAEVRKDRVVFRVGPEEEAVFRVGPEEEAVCLSPDTNVSFVDRPEEAWALASRLMRGGDRAAESE